MNNYALSKLVFEILIFMQLYIYYNQQEIFSNNTTENCRTARVHPGGSIGEYRD